ncbi:hypothetical protein [Halomarina pelagica]|uniref:hypothetical protein n=1 Tax=Halomarina pelagica TaxID=2961599 RepID=UPI0020C36C3D|nr:hypothetical protein [Halomarina sp. BND7]
MVNVAHIRRRLVSRPVLLLFGVFVVTSLLPGTLALPAYLVGMFLYDSAFGLENVVYALVETLGVPEGGQFASLLWEAGLIVTYYLAAVALVWLFDRYRPRFRRGNAVEA